MRTGSLIPGHVSFYTARMVLGADLVQLRQRIERLGVPVVCRGRNRYIRQADLKRIARECPPPRPRARSEESERERQRDAELAARIAAAGRLKAAHPDREIETAELDRLLTTESTETQRTGLA